MKKWADLLNIEENRFNDLNDIVRQICSKCLKSGRGRTRHGVMRFWP